MKKIYLNILLVVLTLSCFSNYAQVFEEESGEFIYEENFLNGIEPFPKKCCLEESFPNISFGYSGFGVPNHDLIQQALEDGLNAWFNRQYDNMENEIESQFNRLYPNYEQARNDYFKHWEKQNILSNARGVKNRYDYRVNIGLGARENFARNLKLLELRELELNLGIINNTSYGAFNFNGTPIGNIRSLSQLNSLRAQEMRLFSSNEVSINHNYGVSQFLSRDIINDMGNSDRFNFDFDILNELLSLQINHYNTIGSNLPADISWYQLDLMQLYLNNVRTQLVLVNVPIRVADYGNFPFLENYANEHRRGGVSLFAYGDYEDYLMEQMLHPNETDERAIDAAEYSAELMAEADRQEYLNNLLEFDLVFVSTLTQGVPAEGSAHPALGADCRSFEYAQPPGALQKGCAVENFNHTFEAYLPDGSEINVDSFVPLAYFTMPPGMTNGKAANLTAIAVTAAIKATDVWYALHPLANRFAVGDFFRKTLQGSMRLIGGSVSTEPPFSIRSPAPYITSLIGPGLGCD